jgi:hypothetical protein
MLDAFTLDGLIRPPAAPFLFLCLQLRFVCRDKRPNFGRHIEQL